MIKAIIKEKIFATKAEIYLCTMNEFNKVAEKKGYASEGEDDTTGLHQVVYKKDDTLHVIWVNSKTKRTDRLNILAHEMVHLVMKRFKRIAVPIGPKNEETFAYFYASMLAEAAKKIGI